MTVSCLPIDCRSICGSGAECSQCHGQMMSQADKNDDRRQSICRLKHMYLYVVTLMGCLSALNCGGPQSSTAHATEAGAALKGFATRRSVLAATCFKGPMQIMALNMRPFWYRVLLYASVIVLYAALAISLRHLTKHWLHVAIVPRPDWACGLGILAAITWTLLTAVYSGDLLR